MSGYQNILKAMEQLKGTGITPNFANKVIILVILKLVELILIHQERIQILVIEI